MYFDFFKSIFLSSSLVACFVSNALGAIEYELHKSDNPTEDELDAYERITDVMNHSIYLYNTYANFTKFLNVYYNPDVPTADGNNDGVIRFGNKRSYMFEGTAMHEIAHTLGIGTTLEYKALMQGGVFKGEKAQALLRSIDGPDAVLKGDDQHFWPYGLNYKSEVHSEQDLINHVRMVNVICEEMFEGMLNRNIEIVDNGIDDCNTLELGYPCCSPEITEVIYHNLLGDWGIENHHLCGITKADPNETCWSIKYNYPCCTTCLPVGYSDESGDYALENGKWCGIPSDC